MTAGGEDRGDGFRLETDKVRRCEQYQKKGFKSAFFKVKKIVGLSDLLVLYRPAGAFALFGVKGPFYFVGHDVVIKRLPFKIDTRSGSSLMVFLTPITVGDDMIYEFFNLVFQIFSSVHFIVSLDIIIFA